MTMHHDSAPTAAAAAGPRPFPFNIWLRAVGAAVDLTHAQRSVLTHMATYATWDTGRDVRPGLDLVAANMHGATKGGVSKSIDALQAAGWLILVSPASKGRGRAAEYRLGIGEFDRFQGDDALIAWTSGKVADPATIDGQKVAIQTKKVAILTKEGCNPDNPPLSTSQDLSSSSVAPKPSAAAPESVGTTGEEEDEDRLFVKLMKLWPNPKARSKTARENARAEWDRLVTRPGFQAETILLHLRRDIESGTVSTSTWPDAWINATFDPATLQAEERQRAAEQRRTTIAECPHCDDHGFLEMPYERGRDAGLWPTDFGTARCPHDNTGPDIIERMFANALARKEGAA